MHERSCPRLRCAKGTHSSHWLRSHKPTTTLCCLRTANAASLWCPSGLCLGSISFSRCNYLGPSPALQLFTDCFPTLTQSLNQQPSRLPQLRPKRVAKPRRPRSARAIKCAHSSFRSFVVFVFRPSRYCALGVLQLLAPAPHYACSCQTATVLTPAPNDLLSPGSAAVSLAA